MNLIFLKLGGSLITDKSKPYTTHPDIISQIVSEIQQAKQENPEMRLIVGNGAGSFAHQSAAKYKTQEGFTDEKGKFGATYVHYDAIKLNQIIIEEFLRQELSAFSIQPSAFITSQDKKLNTLDTTSIETALEKNFIVSIYGDVILDTVLGSTIYSTDRIMLELIKNLQTKYDIKKMISAGNYEGVYDNKKNIIPVINKNNYEQIKQYLSSSENVDVTGGMVKKVNDLVEIASFKIPSYIINGSAKGNVYNLLINDSHIGTLVEYSP